MSASTFSAAGNVFCLVDGFVDRWPEDPGGMARMVSAEDPGVHGLYLIGPPRSDGVARVALFNADGSRAEISGNGLRCVARLLHEGGHVGEEEFALETDVGLRRARAFVEDGVVRRAQVSLGVPQVLDPRMRLEVQGGLIEATHVRVGNPHLVLLVEREERVDVERLGPALCSHPRFPEGINVNFAALRGRVLHLRSYERGVGETPSCGTGSAAAAVAVIGLGMMASPVSVETAGGTLNVEWSRWGAVKVTGPVEARHSQGGAEAPFKGAASL